MKPCPLDVAVLAAVDGLRTREVPAPNVLLLAGTGLGSLPERFSYHHGPTTAVDLDGLDGLPAPWSSQVLHHGSLATEHGPAVVWMLEDQALDAPQQQGEVPWERGFACWLAAKAGATVLLHSSAGGTLSAGSHQPGDLALVRDHLNLTGSSPLLGLGGSKLGPLFPDVSRLHLECLRAEIAELAAGRGLTVAEAIVAATAPASLPSPAEREWFARAGADLWVQGVAAPYLACAHAGLGIVSLVAVTGSEAASADVQAILTATAAAAPGLEELLLESLALAANAATRPDRD
ncbi:MAG: hypothetical protein P1V81_07560 [Planctomycetota bacterium]|nr:hypothetical protein [Planctomycetota bacterium]